MYAQNLKLYTSTILHHSCIGPQNYYFLGHPHRTLSQLHVRKYINTHTRTPTHTHTHTSFHLNIQTLDPQVVGGRSNEKIKTNSFSACQDRDRQTD